MLNGEYDSQHQVTFVIWISLAVFPQMYDFFSASMESLEMISSDIFTYKGMNFLIKDKLRPKDIDAMQDFEIRPSDVFIITFPKSGQIYTGI